MNNKRLKITVLVISVIFMVGCGSTPSSGVIPPEQLGTAIVQTAAVLASQTALFAPPTIPVPDNTVTAIVEPSSTPIATETVTPFIISIATRTPTITQTGTAIQTGTATATKTLNQPCLVNDLVPASNTQFGPGAFFDTVWAVVNTGSTTWNLGSVDFVYQTGTKMHINGDILDMPSTTGPNQSLILLVHMQAPTSAGTYSETWSLKEGSTIYCTVSMVIEVK